MLRALNSAVRLVFAVFAMLATTLTDTTNLRADDGAELRVPAFTAYLTPDPESAQVSEQNGITRWKDRTQSIVWYGKFETLGELSARVEVSIAASTRSELELTVNDVKHTATVVGRGNNEPVTADFSSFAISSTGYQSFTLRSLNPPSTPSGTIRSLVLQGPATVNAHFNMKERRNAASVHLAYPVPKDTDVAAFYCEATAVEEPVTTFYMACGWHRGYFGMQVNSETERRIIFSVWDSGNEAVDRNKVNDENRVKLVEKGDGVYSGDFGNEGTGGHSHLKYMWKTGAKQRFLVTAKPVDKTFTVFSGYWFHPEQQQWMLISSWRAPKEGGYLRGLHSFSENFGGSTGNLLRKARYGNQWIRTPQNEWSELTKASFSHDPTGKSDRLDRFMGVEDSEFFLSHGGFVDGFTKYGEPFTRPAVGKVPADVESFQQ